VEVWIAAAVFIGAYTLIALERFDRTLIALLGGLLVIVLGVIDQHEAFDAIDLNVIFLLAGMMVIASIVARTGLFEWLALRSVRLAHGRPLRLLLILSLVTAVLSAFLDNVTTVVLIVPVTLSVARRLGVSPVPYLISQILASNIGGTATLIGDPPNILIGSAAGLDFNAFLINLGPVTLLVFIGFLLMATSVPLQWQKQYPTKEAADAYLAQQIAARTKTTDANDMIYYFRASEDYDPAPHLGKITAPLLAINSADDFVNPPELPMMRELIGKVQRGRFVLIPISDATRGHGTHSLPHLWNEELARLLQESEK